MADSEVLSELKQLRGQVRDLNLARSGHDDVVRNLGDAIASLRKENAELREPLGIRGIPLPRRREVAWTHVKNKETGRGRPQTPPPATRNTFAALVDECTEEGYGKTTELSLVFRMDSPCKPSWSKPATRQSSGSKLAAFVGGGREFAESEVPTYRGVVKS
ncbi:hypothetical protein GWK47_006922 [Chionoecetes opilio]|uniref:Uncharacterized protein n=1 Tax=Chionoecetes opilio TaxID=41210 RepID=A0A8J5CFD4_CHIOP|nr:hypothetical protein GWK47_006922 [Chionoecetes opilio]